MSVAAKTNLRISTSLQVLFKRRGQVVASVFGTKVVLCCCCCCRLWRNEVEHKKIERTLQLAAEMRQQQKRALVQAIRQKVSQLSGSYFSSLYLLPSLFILYSVSATVYCIVPPFNLQYSQKNIYSSFYISFCLNTCSLCFLFLTFYVSAPGPYTFYLQ